MTRTWIFLVDILTWLQIKNHVQSLAIVRHLLIQTSQVKLVLYVVFINLESMIEVVTDINGINYIHGAELQHTDLEALRKSLTGLLRLLPIKKSRS